MVDLPSQPQCAPSDKSGGGVGESEFDDGVGDSAAFEPASLLRLIRAFLGTHARKREANGNDDAAELDVEAAGSLLWDLTADADVAPLLLRHGLVAAAQLRLAAAVEAAASEDDEGCATGRLPDEPTHGRTAELSLGILANLTMLPEGAAALLPDAAAADQLVDLLGALPNAPAAAELCRLMTAALSTPCGAAVLLPVLATPQRAESLLRLVHNTLHAPLLVNALGLIAALLQASSSSSSSWDTAGAAVLLSAPQSPHEQELPPTAVCYGKQQLQQTQQQQEEQEQQQEEEVQQQQQQHCETVSDARNPLPALLTAGLLHTLASLLAASSAALRAASASPLRIPASWDDTDDGRQITPRVAKVAGAGSTAASPGASPAASVGWLPPSSRSLAALEVALHSKQGVIEGVLLVIQQLALLPGAPAAALAQEPRLSLLLCDLLAACAAAHAQHLLEVLLPLLVAFQAGVVPLLQLQQQLLLLPPVAAWPEEPSKRAAGVDGGTQRETEAGHTVGPLQLLAAVSQCLQDCAADTDAALDAHDAGWWLVAAALRGMSLRQQQLLDAGAAAQALDAAACAALHRCTTGLLHAPLLGSALAAAHQAAAGLVAVLCAAVAGSTCHGGAAASAALHGAVCDTTGLLKRLARLAPSGSVSNGIPATDNVQELLEQLHAAAAALNGEVA